MSLGLQMHAGQVKTYLARSGGRLACPHPQHRFAQVDKSPAEVILPECAGRGPWLVARRGGIGGSEVAALVGVSEYETTFSIWNKKTATEPDEELTGAPIEWGHRLENVVAEKTAEEIGLVSRFGGGLWANREKPFLRVTPDRFATLPRSWKARALIECKTAGDGEAWTSGTITPSGGTGSAPLSYQAQCQWQMGIIGLSRAYLGCFVLGSERQFFTVEIEFDKAWFDEMANAAERFWFDNILGGQVPMHDLRHRRTEELLKQISPVVVRPSVEMPEGTEAWLEDYYRRKAIAEAAQADLDETKNFFRMWTGDAGAGYLGEKKVVSYPVVTTSSINVGRLREEYPEIAQALTEKSTHRRLTITVPKDIKAKVDGKS